MYKSLFAVLGLGFFVSIWMMINYDFKVGTAYTALGFAAFYLYMKYGGKR